MLIDNAKEESYFDKVNNPSDGAYYIETLTEQLAEKALELFKEIEANGGFITQLIEGTIQRKIPDGQENIHRKKKISPAILQNMALLCGCLKDRK